MQQGDPGRVVVVSGSVGAGHTGVANELADRLRARGHEVELLDLLDGFSTAVRILLSSLYVLTIRLTPWTYEATCWLAEHSRLFQRLADAVCCTSCEWLLDRVRSADVVVATYPPAGRALGRLRSQGTLHAPVVTYLTDPAPNYLWVHPANDLHLCVSEATARETEQRYGIPVEAAGPLVAPAFRSTGRTAARAYLRNELTVGPDQRVALVLLGSLGIGNIRAAVGALLSAGLVPVVLCGRNDRLRRRLSRAGALALGWRQDVPLLVLGSDLVVHNAGGLSLTEALVAGVPAVTFAAIPGHGRANAHSLQRSGAAPWARTPTELGVLADRISRTAGTPLPESAETAADTVSQLARVRAGTLAG